MRHGRAQLHLASTRTRNPCLITTTNSSLRHPTAGIPGSIPAKVGAALCARQAAGGGGARLPIVGQRVVGAEVAVQQLLVVLSVLGSYLVGRRGWGVGAARIHTAVSREPQTGDQWQLTLTTLSTVHAH
jgi:hypothetical protein